MNLLERLEHLLGRRSHRSTVDVLTDGRTSRSELYGLAVMSRLSTRDPVVFEVPGPKNEMVLMDDIDPETGKAYPDYLARRAKRREAEEGKPVHCGGGWDVLPDDLD